MSLHQSALIDFFSYSDFQDAKQFSLLVHNRLQNFSGIELAEVFFHVAFLETAMGFLKEEHWLQTKQKHLPETFKAFIGPILKSELLPVAFLQTFFEGSSLKGSNEVRKKANIIESAVIQIVKSRTDDQQKVFATYSLNLMAKLFQYEIKLGQDKKDLGSHLGISLYRTFDRLDEVLGLNYEPELGMIDEIELDKDSTERLYAGGGVGVQSGYSTVLTALRNLDLKSGDRVIDLGSGYGRVGLVMGLLRPDVVCIGYEYVEHRVEMASAISKRLGLENHVQFFTCDLSSPDFKIPDAEVYYLYDPFNDETYSYVLNQLVEISSQHKITIVTKGNARGRLLPIAEKESWPAPREFDNGNLCLFETRQS